MAKINFQFHGTQSEIIEYAKECLNSYNLFMVCIQLFPVYACELVNKNELDDKKIIVDSSQIICLYRFKPNITPTKYMEFININEDCLIFTIGQEDDVIIRESIISTSTVNNDTLKVWKKIIDNFKKSMLNGAWVVNPQNSAKVYNENHRYTCSVKKAFENGIKIGAFAGWCLYILNKEYVDE